MEKDVVNDKKKCIIFSHLLFSVDLTFERVYSFVRT